MDLIGEQAAHVVMPPFAGHVRDAVARRVRRDDDRLERLQRKVAQPDVVEQRRRPDERADHHRVLVDVHRPCRARGTTRR